MILDSTSMIKTIDNINAKYLYGEAIPPSEGLEAALWIISREGGKGSYRGMFAPTPSDFEQGIRVFTGERLVSASAMHIMGQEASRATWLLGRQDPAVREAYDRVTAWMHDGTFFQQSGTFCCGRCTLAFWRHFWVGNFDHKEEFLHLGLNALKNNRTGDGKWRIYPFCYAVYTLYELDLEPARAELIYARSAIERYLKYSRSGVYSQRRNTILQKALELIN